MANDTIHSIGPTPRIQRRDNLLSHLGERLTVSKKGIAMRKPIACLAVLSSVVCLGRATAAFAQDPSSWRGIGPDQGFVRVLAIDPTTIPTTLYAGMVQDGDHPKWGVYRSTDGGMTWPDGNDINMNLPNGFGIFALAIDPAFPSTLYAGLVNGDGYVGPGGNGVFASLDRGHTWNPINNAPLPAGVGVRALVIDPTTTPSTLYAGTDNGYDGTSTGGVFRSPDGGVTWTLVNSCPICTTGSLPPDIRALAIDPARSSTLYAGASAGGVFTSTDSGVTWTPINGCPRCATGSLPIDKVFTTIAIDPVSHALYAGMGTLGDDPGGGVFRSDDGGVTWNDMTSGLPTSDNCASTACTVHALAIAIDPVTTMSTLYAAFMGGGMSISTDGGNSWSPFNNGLGDPSLHAIAINPLVPTEVYTASCNVGVFELGP
jgi:hypothetical protein